jgi:hypothetical protein
MQSDTAVPLHRETGLAPQPWPTFSYVYTKSTFYIDDRLFGGMDRPKQIYFVSWRKHKVEQALTQVDAICNGFIDDLIFETVIDVCRQRFGYPAALPIREIIQNEPVVPRSPFRVEQVHFETPEMSRQQKCPVCHETVDAARFTYHLAVRCFREAKAMEICAKFFEDEAGQGL